MKMNLESRCPFREKTASRRVYLTLARSENPMTKAQVARAAHLPVAKAATLLAAYLNPMHRAPMERVGVRLTRAKDGGFILESCKPKANAKRPPRGQRKTPMKKKKGKKRVPKPQVKSTESAPIESAVSVETEVPHPE